MPSSFASTRAGEHETKPRFHQAAVGECGTIGVASREQALIARVGSALGRTGAGAGNGDASREGTVALTDEDWGTSCGREGSLSSCTSNDVGENFLDGPARNVFSHPGCIAAGRIAWTACVRLSAVVPFAEAGFGAGKRDNEAEYTHSGAVGNCVPFRIGVISISATVD